MSERTFCNATRYGEARDALTAALESLETQPADPDRLAQTLDAYHRFLGLLDGAFPMLLAVGEPLTLQRAPSGTYLLPPIPGSRLRYLVCLFPRTPSQPAGLRLFEWRPDPAPGLPLLCDFGACTGPIAPETPVAAPDCRMAELPSKISTLALNEDMAVFTLDYRNGKLTIVANRQPGPGVPPQILVTWSPHPEPTDLPRAERVSGGNMPIALFIRRRTDPEDWPNDELLDPDGHPVRLEQPRIGRIEGVDGPLGSPVGYLASNLAQVVRVDLASGKVRFSNRLGGKVEDIQVSRDPEDAGRLAILAACYDGRVYWLEDDDTQDQLQVRHWHPMPRLHIQRLVGDTHGHIIALDQYYRLHPLRLNPVAEVKALRNRATEAITRALDKMHGLGHFLVTENGLDGQAEPDPRRFRLLVEIWLCAIRGADWAQPALGYLEDVARDLNQAAQRETAPERALLIASCHEALLRRLWGWMRNQCDGQPCQRQIKDPQRVLHTIADLCTLADQVPDHLWYKVLREYDWLEPWGECMKLDRGPQAVEYRRVLDALRAHVDRQRRALAVRSYPLRPLTIVSSLRLRGQARRLRCLNHEQQSFVCSVPSRGLSTYVRTAGQTPRWQLHAHLDGIAEGLWHGQIVAIATPVDSEENPPPLPLILIATNQGEARSFVVQDGQLKPREQEPVRVPIDCYTARYLFIKRSSSPRRGFLLGGNDPCERACLVWIGLDERQRLRPPQVLYTSEERGRLRLMQDDNEKESPSRIFAIDQTRGLLLCWPLDPLISEHPGRLQEPQVWYRSASELHALYLSSRADPPQAVCGGHDGSVVSLSRRRGEKGRLLWSTGVGGTIRRIRRIQTGDPGSARGDRGLWLLAGDSEDAMLTDDQGRLIGALELVGPVSGTCRLDTGWAVIAAQSGRLLFMDGSPRLVDKRPEYSPLEVYPLRAPDGAPPHPIEVAADLFCSDQPLIAQKGLALIADALGQGRLDPDGIAALLSRLNRPGDRASATTAHRNPPHRTARLIWRLALGGQGAAAGVPYRDALDRLLNGLWDGLTRGPGNEMLGQVVDSVLAVAEPAALQGNEAARRLTVRIGNCLWSDHPGSTCPAAIAAGGQLRLLRLAQAARAWQSACARPPAHPTPTWADTLALVWGTDDPLILDIRLTWLVKSRLPFHGFVDRDPWLELMGDRNTPAAADKLGLTALRAYGEETLITDPELGRLCSVFPDNIHWAQWLGGLTNLIRQVHRSRAQSEEHIAWLERERLVCLRAQVVGAESVLRAQHGLTLAGLFWQRCRDAWTGPIDQRLQALDEAMSGPGLNAYLDVRPHFTWRDARSVEVRLQLHNRASRHLMVTELRGPEGLITEVERNLSLPANQHQTDIRFGIDTPEPDTLDQTVTLFCQDQLGRDFRYDYRLQSSRSLETFSDSHWWPERARRLMRLLEQRGPLRWLRGPWWPDDEHERLERLVTERYAAWSRVEPLDDLAGAVGSEEPICVPDLEPGLTGSTLVDQVQALLHQHKGPGISPLALAIWVHLRPGTPRTVTAALADWIPERDSTRTLLRRCLQVEGLSELGAALTDLPRQRVTAWCNGTPLDHPTAGIDPNLGELGFDVWHRLLSAGVRPADIQDWLGCRPQDLDAMRRSVEQVEALIQPDLASQPRDMIKHRVTPFLAVLTTSEPGFAGEVCYAQTAGNPRRDRIDLLHATYSHVYCLLPGQNLNGGQARPTAGLWLLVTRNPPPDLPGAALRMEADDLLAFLCAHDRDQAMSRLNQLAAIQHGITSSRIFQMEPGLPPEKIDRAFHGRTREIHRIRELLDLHDEEHTLTAPGKSACVLLVGGRKIGKTTLLQRIEQDLRSRGDRRPWILLTCSGVHGEGATLLRWFLNRLREGLKGKEGQARYVWTDPNNPREREEAIREIKQLLMRIRERRGHQTVLLLDETLALTQHDARGHPVGWFLKDLIQDDLLSIIATTYPHGIEQGESLYRLVRTNRPDNPWFNLFGEPVMLDPWSPRETWKFLQTRLEGFGILLPESLAGEVLDACRGFPWIAHLLGIRLCETARERRRVISTGDWERALRLSRDQVLSELRQTVRSVAKVADEKDGLDPDQYPQRAFSPQNLWDALALQATWGKLEPVSPEDESWPGDLPVDAHKISLYFKGQVKDQRISEVLDALTHTGILVGQDSAFVFCKNLFPVYVQLWERQ